MTGRARSRALAAIAQVQVTTLAARGLAGLVTLLVDLVDNSHLSRGVTATHKAIVVLGVALGGGAKSCEIQEGS